MKEKYLNYLNDISIDINSLFKLKDDGDYDYDDIIQFVDLIIDKLLELSVMIGKDVNKI